jgi:hypothetical protein
MYETVYAILKSDFVLGGIFSLLPFTITTIIVEVDIWSSRGGSVIDVFQ